MRRTAFFSILALLLCSAAHAQSGGLINGARGFPVPNDPTTGTTLNGTAKILPGGTAIAAGTADSSVPTYLVVGGAGTTGNAVLANPGSIGLCTMDTTIASGAAWYYVVNSTTTAKECHAQAAAPAGGTWVIGFLWDSSTTLGATARVEVNLTVGGFVGSGGLPIEVNGAGSTNTLLLNLIGAGLANVTCTNTPNPNSCTFSASSGGAGPAGVNKTNAATYTVPTTDDQIIDDFTSNAAVTLPQPNTISTSPFIATRSLGAAPSCTPSCTTSSFTPANGDILLVALSWTDTSTSVSGVTDSAGTTCAAQTSGQPLTASANGHTYWLQSYICSPTTNSPQTIQFTFSSNVTLNSWGAAEYAVTATDRSLFGILSNASGNTNLATGPVNTSYINEIILSASFGSGAATLPVGYVSRVAGGAFTVSDRLVSSLGSYFTQIPVGNTQGAADAISSYAISATPGFTAGWLFYVEADPTNTGTVTITPTSSTINGGSTLVLYPSEFCLIESDGTNYTALCGTAPAVNIPLAGPWVPVYGSSGTPKAVPHAVQGTGTLSGGTLAVTFTNAALFTSSSSYQCWAVDTTTPANSVISSTYTSGSSVTFTGTGTDAFRYTCLGN